MAVLEPCITVEVFEHGTRRQLPLVRPDDAERRQVFKLRFEGSAVTPRWDVAVSEGQHIDVQVLVYENDGAARYGAFLEDVQLGGGEVIVRLYPFQEWACPGRGSAPRALHAAVAINPDQVLIFGGVSGRDLDPLSARDPRAHGGALPVDTIELYDGRTHRFTTLPITSFDEDTAFRRTLFDAVLVGEEPNPTDPTRSLYRVRVIGGFTGPLGSPLLHFDNVGTRGVGGSPFVPSIMAEIGRTVDLVVDPVALSVAIEDAEFAAPVPRGGLLEVSDFFGVAGPVDPALVLIGLRPDGLTFTPSALTYSYTREGMAVDIRNLANVRLGASVHVVPQGFVVWGGNVNHGGDVSAAAGEFLPAMGGAGVPISATGGLPMPTAFHTGTTIGPTTALIAGGFEVDATGSVLSAPSPTPIFFLEAGAGIPPALSARLVPTPVDHVNTIFHTATPIPGLGVVLVGGAGVDMTGNRLAPQSQVAFINGASYTAIAGAALSTPRWGHTTTVLGGHRLLVVGGFTRDTDSTVSMNAIEAIRDAEIFFWDPAPRDLFGDECAADQEERDDAAVDEVDAGLPPRVDAGFDSGLPDTGVPDGG